MHPEIAKTLVEQRHEELTRTTAKTRRTVAVDRTPGECVRSPVMRCFGEAGVAAAEPEVLAARGHASNECASDSRRPMQAAKYT